MNATQESLLTKAKTEIETAADLVGEIYAEDIKLEPGRVKTALHIVRAAWLKLAALDRSMANPPLHRVTPAQAQLFISQLRKAIQ